MASTKKILAGLLPAAILIIAVAQWKSTDKPSFGPEFASGHGRLEATEIDISAKMGGKIREIRVDEGDYIKDGDLLAIMDTSMLEARLYEAFALAALTRAHAGNLLSHEVASESDIFSAQADENHGRYAEIRRRFERIRRLTAPEKVAKQPDAEGESEGKAAPPASGPAETESGSARAATPRTTKVSDEEQNAAIRTALANVATVESELLDCYLFSPHSGRVQYRVAQPGEVVAPGGKVLNFLDMDNVYMNVFLCTSFAGQAAIGSEARIVLDSFPDNPIPATVTYVSETAQFTPKMVETSSERQKLMFRIKVKIDPEVFQDNPGLIKPGLPGVAWVRLNKHALWPSELEARVPGKSNMAVNSEGEEDS